MGGGTVTPRSESGSVLRPNVNQPLIVSADCLAGELVVGGGVRLDATVPTDLERTHLQQSGPTGSGWLGQVSATSRFSSGSTLTLTTTAYCLAP